MAENNYKNISARKLKRLRGKFKYGFKISGKRFSFIAFCMIAI